MTRTDVFRMVQRRTADAGLSTAVCCHSFRATGITAYLENGGTLYHVIGRGVERRFFLRSNRDR